MVKFADGLRNYKSNDSGLQEKIPADVLRNRRHRGHYIISTLVIFSPGFLLLYTVIKRAMFREDIDCFHQNFFYNY